MPARTVDSPKAVEKPILENEVSVFRGKQESRKGSVCESSEETDLSLKEPAVLVRLEIARDLGIIREEDAHLAEGDLYPKYFVRAKESQSWRASGTRLRSGTARRIPKTLRGTVKAGEPNAETLCRLVPRGSPRT